MTTHQDRTAAPAPQRLRGRTAIVTGASRGIGLAIACRLAAEGADVALTARTPETLAEVITGVLSDLGRLDVLVLNAGINPAYGPLLDLDVAAARKILEVNVLAPLTWLQRAASADPVGFATRGSVVTITSVTGDTPSPGIGMYGVSKAALAHLTRALAAECGPGLRVNAVSPAVVETRFARALYEGHEEETAAAYPMKRLGHPDDVAAAVAYLASDDATWVTGEVLTVDGGLAVAGGTA